MSIHAAIAALEKEIEAVAKKKARLESMRDALAVEAQGAEVTVASSTAAKKGKPGPKPGSAKKAKPGPKPAVAKKGKPGPKPGAKKTSTVQESVAAKSASSPKKRVMSAEAKKRIGDAQRARWAKNTATKKAA
jgi:hypothetical protein